MASIVTRKYQGCKCQHKGCKTGAVVTKWTCGCVTVDVKNNTKRCSHCTDFSKLVRSCGKKGKPGSGCS